MKKSLYFGLIAVLGLVGCTRNQEIDISDANLSLVAKTESSSDSRTIVEGGCHVYWEPGDEIMVFTGEISAKFTTDITASSASATFNGTFGEETWPDDMELWAVYPYSEEAVFDGETITTVLPSEQVARVGSFGKDMNLAVAHSTGTTLQFYNVGGGIRFSVTEEGIKKVMFEGLGGEIISGKVKIGFENGLPVVQEVSNGSQFITLLPPEGSETFQKDTWYYIVAIPGVLEKGYKLRFYKDSDYARKVSEKAVQIKRSIYGNIEKADEGIEYEATTTHFPETEEEWGYSDQMALDVTEKIHSIVSALASSDEFCESIQDVIDQVLLIDGVLSVSKTEDSKGIMIQLSDESWINYMYEIPGYYDIEEDENETPQINNHEPYPSKANKVYLNKTTPNNKKALIVAPYQSRGCNGDVSRGFISIDYNYVEEQLNSVGYLVTSLKNKNFTISDLTGDKLKQYGLIIFGTHGNYALRSSDGEYQTIIDTGIDFKEKDSIPQRERLARVIYYDDNGKNGHYNLTASWLRGTISDQTAGAYGNAIVIMSACLSYRISDLAYYFIDHGATAYCGNYSVSGIPLNKPLVNSMVHSLCCGLDAKRAVEYSERDPLFTDHLLHEFILSQHPFSFHSLIRDDVYEAFLVNPYPKDLFRRVDNGYVTFSWEQNKTNGNYSFDLYVDGNKLKTTYGKSFKMYTDILGEHNWYVVANLTLNGEIVASYRTDGKPFTILDQHCVTPRAVDLGLSVKWGSFNLGATERETYDCYYYAWGETDRIIYGKDWEDYAFMQRGYDDEEHITKYTVPDGEMLGYDSIWYDGTTFIGDNKTTLDPEDDAAHVRLGDYWRMPTWDEYTELRNNCTWEWVTRSGVNGYKVTSKIDGYQSYWIFLPADGGLYLQGSSPQVGNTGSYWTSTLCAVQSFTGRAYEFASNYIDYSYSQRTFGYPIRPVYDDRIRVSGIQLNRTSMSLTEGSSFTLVATIQPSNATDKRVRWSSSNKEVADVSSEGFVQAIRPGTAVITVTTVDGNKTATCSVSVKEESIPTTVDLGLSVKWRSFNLGASRPEDYGDSYAWGETTTKSFYEWSNYLWCKGTERTLTKYCTDSSYGYNGFTDGKTDLDSSDDVVYQKLKGNWRIPTRSDYEELNNNCTFEKTSRRGVAGFKIISNVPGYTDKWIFLPNSAFWLRSGYGNDAAGIAITQSEGQSDPVYDKIVLVATSRAYGCSIRPVCDK